MKIKDIMTTNVQCVNQGEPITRAAEIMRQEDVGSVPVEEYNKLVGILTDRDIVLRDVAEAKDPTNTVCGEIMSKDVVACSPEMDADEVANLMSQHQIRRIPVVENEKVVGIVALGDFATKNNWSDEAGEALSDISCQDHQH
ncbi:CBS domain-containing protein [Vallitalea okinawensis]|uniref:CBS domain-containing protein n=1 Tax=Vallitalea okinawensis TaxID=2078660 RepID=UPI000CFBFD6B|nr:CBS domain-containing protein [Vallitalea okinawensis]